MRKYAILSSRTFIILLASLISFHAASAEVLTLDQCVKIAIDNNYTIQGARNAYSTSRAQLYNAWGSILPNISISTSADHSWNGLSRSTLLPDSTVITLAKGNNSYSGSLNFSLSYGGLGIGTYASINRASHARSSSFYGLASTQATVVQQVKADYYGVVRSKGLVDVAINSVKRDQEGLRVAQSRFDLGAASLSDVLKARVQLGNDQLDSVTEVNTYQLALASLAYDMGVDVNKDIEIDENLPPVQFNMTFEDALNEAIANNPDYRKSQFDYAVAKDVRLQAYSALLPGLSFGLTHSTSVDRFSDLFQFKEANADYTVFARISFNIFNNFSDYANIKQASNQVLTQSENLNNTKNNVALVVKQAFLNLAQANEAKRLSDESVASAQEDLNIIHEKYSLGAATILDLLTAEASLTQAQQNQVQAVFQYNIGVSQVERALGR